MDTKAINIRLKQIFSAHSHEEIIDFIQAYAYENQSLALALIDAFGTFDTDDAQSLVEQCFLHPSTNYRLGTKLNWYTIGEELGRVYQKATELRKQGDDLGAALIGRYMLTMTYREYMDDHPDLEQTRGLHGELYVREVLDMLRELLIEGNSIDFDTRKGMLKEIDEELKSIKKKAWLGRLDQFLDDAKAITMTRKGYLGFIHRKIASTYGCFRLDNIERLMLYLLKHDELDEARKVMQQYPGCCQARVLLIDYLADHQLYDEAIQTIHDNKDTFNSYSFKLDDKLIEILKRQGDKQKLMQTCRERFLVAEYRWPYYLALKEAVPSKEWPDYLKGLLKDCDFKMDCDNAEVKIYKAEKLYHLYAPYFQRGTHVDLRNWPEYGGLMTTDEQRLIGEKISLNIIEIAKRQNNRRDYRFVAEEVTSFMKASPIAKEMGDKLIDRILEAVPGRPALYDELMKIFHRSEN